MDERQTFEEYVEKIYKIPSVAMEEYLSMVLIEAERTAAIRRVTKYGHDAHATVSPSPIWEEKNAQFKQCEERVLQARSELDAKLPVIVPPLFGERGVVSPVYQKPFKDEHFLMQFAINEILNEISQVQVENS